MGDRPLRGLPVALVPAKATPTAIAERLALLALQRADYAAAKEAIAVTPERAPADERARIELIRAQIARIESDLAVWLEASTFAARHLADPGKRLTARALRVGVLRRLGDTEVADRLREAVDRELLQGAPDENGLGTYLLAVDAWEARRYDVAETLVARNVAVGRRLAESHSLRAWIAVREERYRAAAAHFGRALTAMKEPDDDPRLSARNIHGALMIASDVIDLRLGRRARDAYVRLAPSWPATLHVERFNIERCLRNLALLEGDLSSAFAAARAATAHVPTPAFAALAEIYGAELSRILGDRVARDIQLRRAWSSIRQASWVGIDTEQRMTLTTFALEAATSMPAEARKAITIYRSLEAKAKPQNALENDRRVVAFDFWAAGRVCELIDDVDGAIRGYTASRELFSTLQYDVRAALVALDLERLTRSGEHRQFIETVLRRAPKAWIGNELDEPSDALRELRPAQLEVLVRLLEGFSAKAIAEDLDRSHDTVINHTRKIFAAFEVNARDELFRACRAAAVTPDVVRARLMRGRPS